MTLASYVAALRSTAELPEPVRERAATARSFDPEEMAGLDDARRIEEHVETMERFTEEQPTARLPDRSVLTLAGLADVRFGARLLAAADAVESDTGLGAIRARGARSADVLLNDPDVEQMIADIEQAARYDPAGAAAGAPAPVDLGQLEKELQAQVDAVLKTGEAAVRDLAGAVGWGAVAGSAGKAIAGAVQRSALLQAAAKGLNWLKRLALRAIEAGFKALQKAIGEGPLAAFLDKGRQRLAGWLDGGGVGDLLGRLLDAAKVAPACTELVRAAGGTEPQQAAALGAATHVAEHAERLAGVSDKVTDVVGWFGGMVWKSPVGPYLAAGFVVAIGAAIWQVQDHLDATEPFALPDVTEGMRSAVAAAVAAA
jgi:hypothetical protein